MDTPKSIEEMDSTILYNMVKRKDNIRYQLYKEELNKCGLSLLNKPSIINKITTASDEGLNHLYFEDDDFYKCINNAKHKNKISYNINNLHVSNFKINLYYDKTSISW